MSKQIEKMNKLIADAEAVFTKAKGEGRELSGEEFAAYEKSKGEILALRKTIEAEKELAGMHFAQNTDALTQTRQSKAETEANQGAKPDDKLVKERFNKYLRTGDRAGLTITGEDGKQEFTISTATASGVIVPRTVETPIVVRRMWNAILNACLAMNQPIVGLDSESTETIVLPVMDDSAVSGQDTSETANTDTAADPSASTISLGATLVDSKSLWYSNTQLKALPYDLAAYMLPILDKRCELQMDSDWTTKLLAPTASGNTLTTASATGLTYAEFVQWYHKLAPQFRVDGVWIISDGLLSVIEQLSDDQHRPLLSLEAPMTGVGAVRTLRGCPVFISNSLVTPAAGAISGVFVSAGSLHPRVCGNKRIAVYQNLPTYPDQTGYRQFVNADFGVSAGVAFLKHAAS